MSTPAPRRERARRPSIPRWSVPLIVVGVLLASEVGARVVGPNIERESGSEERAFIKADQMYERGAGTTDVVFVGASETAGGLVPSSFLEAAPSLSGAYNAALSGAALDVTAEWTDRVVIPVLDPEVVVIGIIPGVAIDYRELDFDVPDDPGPAYRSAFDTIAPGGFGTFGWQLRQRSALIRYRPQLREPTDLLEGIRTTLTGGLDPLPERDDTRLDFQTESDPRKVAANTAPDGEILDYRDTSVPGDDSLAAAAFTFLGAQDPYFVDLERLVDDIRASGAEPVIAFAPVDRERLLAAGADLRPMDSLRDAEAAWAAERDVLVFDRFDTAWPPDHWHDREHVAQAGADRWSRELGEFLESACQDGRLGDAC
jgi:hypothetical protein